MPTLHLNLSSKTHFIYYNSLFQEEQRESIPDGLFSVGGHPLLSSSCVSGSPEFPATVCCTLCCVWCTDGVLVADCSSAAVHTRCDTAPCC